MDTKLTCNICSQTFSRITYLKNHLQTKRHIENSKQLQANTNEKLYEAPNADEIDNSISSENKTPSDGELDDEEDSVVPNQI